MKTKILFSTIIGYPYKSAGGGNRVIYEIINGLNPTLFNSSFMSYKLYFPVFYESLIPNIHRFKTYLFNKNNIYRKIVQFDYLKVLYHVKAFKLFKQNIKQIEPIDYIHAHDTMSMFLLQNIKCKKKILSIHTKGLTKDDIRDSFSKINTHRKFFDKIDEIENSAIQIADEIIFPSYAAKKIFLNSKNVDKSKIKIIYNGIKQSKYCCSQTSELYKLFDDKRSSPKILNIADHIKVKNIDVVLKAINILKFKYNQKPILINIGKGVLTNELKAQARILGIENEVKFISYLENLKIRELLELVDYFVTASERVIFDYVILEALISGPTVIASDAGGNKEIIQHGVNGYLFDPSNSNELAELLITKPKRMRECSRFIEEKFSYEYFIKQHENLYQL